MASHHFLKILNRVLIRTQDAFPAEITGNQEKLHDYRFQNFIRSPAIWEELVRSTQKDI